MKKKIKRSTASIDTSNIKVEVSGDLNLIRRNARRAAAPVRVLPSYAEVAHGIILPDGPMQGYRYDPLLDPVHAASIKLLDSGDWRRFVVVGAVQTGKSLAWITLPLLRCSTYGKQSVVYSQPTMAKLNEAWTGKIYPMISAGEWASWLPLKGQGARGSQTPNFVVLEDPRNGRTRAGMVYMVAGGGSSEAAQASITAPVVLVDEVDSYKSRHRVELIGKRADAYGSKSLKVYTSTVKDDESSIILGMYQEGTRSRLWFACPHCGRYQPMEWTNVKYEATDELTARETARYMCSHCAVLWSEDDRRAALRRWELVHAGQELSAEEKLEGDTPRTETCSFLWTALDSSLRSLGDLVVEHYRASQALAAGEHGAMRSFFRDQLCKMYTGERDEMEMSGPLSWQMVLQRSQRDNWGPVRHYSDRDGHTSLHTTYSRYLADPPEGATHAIGTIDVQHDRVYWLLQGFNREGTIWYFGWGYEYARPDHAPYSTVEFNLLIDRTIRTMRETCQHVPLLLIGIDCGDQTDMVLDYEKANRHQGVRAVKGATMDSLKVMAGDITGVVYIRDGVFHVATDAVRDGLHAALRRPNTSPGATRLPNGMDYQGGTICKHLVNEQTGWDTQKLKITLLKAPGRHDWLDTGIYGRALILGYLTWENPAEELAKAPRPEQPIPVNAEVDESSNDGPVKVQRSALTISEKRTSFIQPQRRSSISRRR